LLLELNVVLRYCLTVTSLQVDKQYLEQLCRTLGDKYGPEWAAIAAAR
jgi:hypothetical protein